jgi:hypothetical protein
LDYVRALLNLRQGGNCVGNNHGVTVSEKLMKLMEKSPILNQLRIDIK